MMEKQALSVFKDSSSLKKRKKEKEKQLYQFLYQVLKDSFYSNMLKIMFSLLGKINVPETIKLSFFQQDFEIMTHSLGYVFT